HYFPLVKISGNPVIRFDQFSPVTLSFNNFFLTNYKIPVKIKGKLKEDLPASINLGGKKNFLNLKGNLLNGLKLKGKLKYSQNSPGNVALHGNTKIIQRDKNNYLLTSKGNLDTHLLNRDFNLNYHSHLSFSLDNPEDITTEIEVVSPEKSKLNANGILGKNGPEVQVNAKINEKIQIRDLLYQGISFDGSVGGTWDGIIIKGDLKVDKVKAGLYKGNFEGRLIYQNHNIQIKGILSTRYGKLKINYNFSPFKEKQKKVSITSKKLNFFNKYFSFQSTMNFFFRKNGWQATFKGLKKNSFLANLKIILRGRKTKITSGSLNLIKKNIVANGSWEPNQNHFRLNIHFKNYKLKKSHKKIKFSGTINGSLQLTLKKLELDNFDSFLENITSARGNLKISRINTSPWQITDEMEIFLKGSNQKIKVRGKSKERFLLAGKMEKGKFSGEINFNQMDFFSLGSHKTSNIVSSKANGKLLINNNNNIFSFSIEINKLLLRLKTKHDDIKKLVFRNENPIRINYDKGRFVFANKALLKRGHSTINVGGSFSRSKLNLKVASLVSPAIFLPLFSEHIKRIKGKIASDLEISGTMQHPVFAGNLRTRNLFFSTTKNDDWHHLQNSTFIFNNNKLIFSDLGLEYHDKKAELSGFIKFNNYLPKTMNIHLGGEVDSSILKPFFSKYINKLKGPVVVDFKFKGKIAKPEIKGELQFNGVNLSLRGYRHSLQISSGRIMLNRKFAKIKNIKGHFRKGIFKLNGRVALYPALHVSLNLKGNGIYFRTRKKYYAEINPDLVIEGETDQMKISGRLDVVSGKYVRKFDFVKKAITIRRFKESPNKIWKRYPWTGEIKLDLNVHNSGNFKIKNNIANLSLEGLVNIKGTLAKPEFKGAISINQGTFNIPFLKGTFSTNRGMVDFDKTTKPFLALEGRNIIQNNKGDEIVIKLSLKGPLDKIRFSLSSYPEMSQGQLLVLMASGKTMDEFRDEYNNNISTTGGMTQSSLNPVEKYDQPIKQITGDFLSDLVSNPIKMITKLDLFRMELGSDSFQLKLSKKIFKRVKFKGEVEVGFLGKNRQESSMEIKFHDRISLDSSIRRFVPDVDEYEYEDPVKGRIQLKYKLKLKGSLKDIFGY
ncbi:MAG: translocation/assembly module TamB domain-containing protein, partial [Myxococcota bacterium]